MSVRRCGVRTCVGLVLVASVLASEAVDAQAALPDSGARVRIHAPRVGLNNTIATFVGLAGDTIRAFIPNTGVWSTAVRDVQRLEVSMGDSRGGKATTGAGIGVAAGLAVGVIALVVLSGADVPDGTGPAALVGGAAAGGLLGWMIGSTMHGERWQRVPLVASDPRERALP